MENRAHVGFRYTLLCHRVKMATILLPTSEKMPQNFKIIDK